MLVRLQRKRNTSPLLVGLQTDTTTLEISLAIPQKTGHSTTWRSSYSTSGHIPQRHSNKQQRYMHHNVHNSSIYISQKLEKTKMSFSRWMDTKIVEYYSTIRNSDFMKFLRKWVHLENIILNVVTQFQRNRHNIQSLNTPRNTSQTVWSSRKEKIK